MKDLNGNEIKRYNSGVEAAKDNGFKKSDISKCCRGKQKTVKGYVFEYSGEYSNSREGVYLNENNKYKCPYCEKRFESFNGLCQHVLKFKMHNEKTKEELLTDFKYGGVRPTCKCGCGEYTDIAYDGEAHFRDYKWGHASRIHNNWGHNIKAVINSSNKRREQFASGERKPWNEGKSFEETYGKEISDNLKENIRTKLYERIKDEKFKISSKLEDVFEEEALSHFNVEYVRQYYIKEIKQFCDFYIPSINCVIEIDGTFWHCDPNINNKPTYDYQCEKIKKDLIKNKYCIDNGIKICRFWENDIKKNIGYVLSKLSLVIENDFEEYVGSLQGNIDHSFILLDLLNDCELKNNPSYFRKYKEEHPNTVIVYEDEWLNKREIVKDRIDNLLGVTKNKIYARKCQIQTVKRKEALSFLEENHLQGGINSKFYYGLYFNGELVSLMTFCGLRKNLGSTQEENTYELLRFCNKLGYTVVGSASRLLNHFIKTVKPNKIISYCDKRWSDGNFYEKIGFTLDHETKENYYYCFGSVRKNRFGYRKDILVKLGYDKEKTEKEIMFERNIMRVYDCGSNVYTLIVN